MVLHGSSVLCRRHASLRGEPGAAEACTARATANHRQGAPTRPQDHRPPPTMSTPASSQPCARISSPAAIPPAPGCRPSPTCARASTPAATACARPCASWATPAWCRRARAPAHGSSGRPRGAYIHSVDSVGELLQWSRETRVCHRAHVARAGGCQAGPPARLQRRPHLAASARLPLRRRAARRAVLDGNLCPSRLCPHPRDGARACRPDLSHDRGDVRRG